MSTRAVITFIDSDDRFSVYQHCDGYPSGMAASLIVAIDSGKCWPLPRFEADEFAAGFIAANKDHSGNYRCTTGPDRHGDLEYIYTFDGLNVKCFEAGNTHPLFQGAVTKFIAWAKKTKR
jgi:hypothetical protein